MKLAFLIDPIHILNPVKDTSLSFMDYARTQGHEVYVFEASDLYVDDLVRANVQKVIVNLNKTPCYETVEYLNMDLSQLDALFIRKDPPVNDPYNNMLQILSVLEDQSDVFIVNSPAALLKANEKIYGTRFAEFCPKTRITASFSLAWDFIQSLPGKAIIKPVNHCGSN
ncbi:hypothetical protein MJH12_19875 [bacterium]|nr:hypothetical protein [bacterium]